MRFLQKQLESSVENLFSIENVALKIIEKHLEELEVHLSKDQKEGLRQQLMNKGFNDIDLLFGDDQITPKLLAKRENGGGSVYFDLCENDKIVDDIVEQLAEELSEQLAEYIPELVDKIYPLILKTLRKNAVNHLKQRKEDQKAFEIKISHDWGNALKLLEMMVSIAFDAGVDFNDELRSTMPTERKHTMNTLTRLHGRSCQITSEVLTLLRSGYSDGAHARWRCLHEVAVVSLFITEHDDELAERYILHEAIESYKTAKSYQLYCESLGEVQLKETELNELRLAYNELVDRFGKEYRSDYGWAANVLDNKRPTFRDIEEYVGLEHLRPLYKMASHNVHANPKGIFFKLGIDLEGPDRILAGPSQFGLADPGHATALSLYHSTCALLTSEPTLDRLVICRILEQLKNEVTEAFFEMEESFKE